MLPRTNGRSPSAAGLRRTLVGLIRPRTARTGFTRGPAMPARERQPRPAAETLGYLTMNEPVATRPAQTTLTGTLPALSLRGIMTLAQP